MDSEERAGDTGGARGAAWAVVVAAGEGRRLREGDFASAPSKPFVDLAGKPILLRTLEAVAACVDVARVVVAVREEDLALAESLVEPCHERLRVASIVAGGERRQDSVARALEAVPPGVEVVAVHDGARPLASPALFARVIAAARASGAACASLPARETLKRVDDGEARAPVMRGTVPREGLWAAQTPQAFRAGRLRELLAEAAREGVRVTDDAELHDRKGLPVAAVRGEAGNLKITVPEDLAMAEAILAAQTPRAEGAHAEDCRVGGGYDIHRLVDGRRLVVCGVELASPVGPEGHSDADAAAHALIDALLGACAAGDVGRLFPDTDLAYRDADSMELLKSAAARVREAGFAARSVDLTVFLAAPKLAPHVDEMRRRLADAVGTDVGRVSVKAKTMNGLGPVGEGKAYAAQATVLVASGVTPR